MKTLGIGLLSSVVAFSLSTAALADQKPRNARIAPKDKIVRLYAGKSDLWEQDCSGGNYFAPNGQTRAWCGSNPDSFGAGTWTADDQGRMCYQLRWYWREGNNTGVSNSDEQCILHVVDGWGAVWRNWPGSSEWWKAERSTRPVKGYKFQKEIQETRDRLGV